VLDDIFVIDGVAHAFDLSEANFADPALAAPVNHLIAGLLASQPPGFDLNPEACWKDWQVDDTANLLFRESHTDVAIFHPVPIYFYKDGLSGFHKAVEATTRWPNRFIGSYIAVDPLRDDPLGEIERQAEELDNPVGLKLYPISYVEGKVTPWLMDDPELGFPMYEKARSLGINHVAIHKSLPLGPAPSGGDAFHPRDVEGAAAAFPDMTFSIVHGGMSFTEETAWLMARFENIWINMETLNIMLSLRPRVFERVFAGILGVAGEAALARMYWGSGAMNCHPRCGMADFLDFQFSEEVRETEGLFFPIPELTKEHKRAIFCDNIARLHGLDVDALKAGTEGDEFAREPGAELPIPYSTTSLANDVMTPAGAAA
jgi:predicted TIM-barrel fold metal-dependent hydrolase